MTTQICVRMSEETKNEAEKVLEELGLSTSTAVNAFFKKIARERRIPFDFTLDPFYSKSNQNFLQEQLQKVKNNTAKLEEHELIEV